MIQTITAQKRLVILWAFGFLFLIIFLIVRSVGDIYGTKVSDAWSWFLPTTLPTVSLMITVIIMDFGQQKDPAKQTDRFLFQLAYGLSLVYLLLVAFTILNPVNPNSSSINFMKQSSLWLGPVQGLVTALLGAFFIKSK